MTLMLSLMSIAGFVVAALTLWIQFRSYILQRLSAKADPGELLSPDDASAAFDGVTEDPVRAIASRYVFAESEKKPVGYIRRQPIAVYLDLHTASCIPANRIVLAKSLGDFVRNSIRTDPNLSIATPREGNLILGSRVAEYLNLNFLMIRTGRAPRFGYPIEGSFRPGSRVVIVDDLCMEGTFLTRCVQYLRKYGINVSDCFCLFERLDGDAREELAKAAVTLHSKYKIDDDELGQLQSMLSLETGSTEYQQKTLG